MELQKTKVRFEFYNSVLDREEVETLWADVLDEQESIYRLDNIPYFVTNFSDGDIVKAIKMNDELPTVIELIEASGNSTLNIIFFENNDELCINRILNTLNDLGAEYEGMEQVIKGYYSINIPKNIDYKPIKDLLTHESEFLDYREASLAHKL